VIFIAANPYVIAELPFADTIIVTYGVNKTSVDAAVKVIFGDIIPVGALPVKIPKHIDSQNIKIIAHD
jgi:hypothetical protein